MINKNKDSTRYYSNKQEEYVSKLLSCYRQSNSGAGNFNKGDLINKDASLLVECKTNKTNKDSFSIKKGWLDKNKEETFSQGLDNHCLAFNFNNEGKENYFIINEKLMQFLVQKLEEDNTKINR